jgi:hypothetical protein
MIEPGTRFGRLIVVEKRSATARLQPRYLVECICGGTKVVRGESLLRGRTKSCGCIEHERIAASWYWHRRTARELTGRQREWLAIYLDGVRPTIRRTDPTHQSLVKRGLLREERRMTRITLDGRAVLAILLAEEADRIVDEERVRDLYGDRAVMAFRTARSMTSPKGGKNGKDEGHHHGRPV